MTTVLIDGHHAAHRVAFIPELQKLTTRRGVPTGSAFGFLRVLRATLNRFKADSCLVVWDTGRSAYRKKLYPEYKANRDEAEKPAALDTIEDQIGILQGVLPYLNVKQLAIKGYEGDDLLWLAVEAVRDDNELEPIVIVTGDKDLLQLVDTGVAVYRPIADELITDKNFTVEVGVPNHMFCLRKALVGDKSDNIDGIRGVGEKTANKFMEECLVDDAGEWFQELDVDDLKDFKEFCEEHKGKIAPRIAEGWETVERNLKLMDIKKFPFDGKDKKKARAVVNADLSDFATDIELLKVFGKWEFNDIVSKYVQWIRPFKRLRCGVVA
jgi:DNA polymerase-1